MHNSTHTNTTLSTCSLPSFLPKLEGMGAGYLPLEDRDSAPSVGRYLAQQTHEYLHNRQVELTVLVAPVTSKFLDSIHNSSGSQELHGGGRVHCPPTCSSGGVSPQRREKQNTKAQEGKGGGSQAFWEAGALFLRTRARFFPEIILPCDAKSALVQHKDLPSFLVAQKQY